MILPNRYTYITGRAASAIFLLLKHLKPTGTLLAPANICYAALYPAIYAGWQVRLFDVSPQTGNAEPSLLVPLLDHCAADVILLPHMYGQPIENLPQLVSACHMKNIVVIEDCASSMGAQADYPFGLCGDYTIYSTGYAKIVEVGFGGILTSEHDDLAWVKDAETALPYYSPGISETEMLFSRTYRILRNYGDHGDLEDSLYRSLLQGSRSLFLFRLTDDQKHLVEGHLTELDDNTRLRRELCSDFYSKIDGKGIIRQFAFSSGAVPWRFNLFLPADLHRDFIDQCLKSTLPVSDWYPCIAPMLGIYEDFPNCSVMENTIVNFPLHRPILEQVESFVNQYALTHSELHHA